MNLINTENDKNYISLKEVIELLAKESNSNIWEVATYLLNKDMHIHLYSHSRGTDHKIVQSSFLTYEGGQNSWIGDNDAFAWLQYIAENEMRSHAPRTLSNFARYYNGCIETFWDREAFFENEDIKKALKLSSNTALEPILLDLTQVSYEEYNTDQCIILAETDYSAWAEIEQHLNDEDKKNDIAMHKLECESIKYYQKKYSEIQSENEKIKAELLNKEQKIRELESIELNKGKDLLSLIFDETKEERYSPDLVLSIKLWEHIYIVNPKKDSHSNKADTWLKANTGYDVIKKAGSASKIREITTPFVNWSPHRDKKFKK